MLSVLLPGTDTGKETMKHKMNLTEKIKDRGGLYFLISIGYAEYIADKSGNGFVSFFIGIFKNFCES